jgi:hypothetical protein
MEQGSIAGGISEGHLDRHKEVATELPDEFSALRAIHPHWAECDPDDEFDFGLDLLIRGVLERVRSQTPDP